MNKNIFEIVEEVLKTNEKYIADDGKLLKAVVYSDIMAMDKELLSLLLSQEKIRERFFQEVDGTLVFDKQKFAWFIESKEFLPDSYTRYTNKIGLTHEGSFISKTNDVVLDFPYKDCVLEGGQDKDDQKREEIFYHETIASDEIRKMLAPKVLGNAKRYTKGGVEENITFDEKDNLIIKGNNLIALSSLLKRYEGKVKCIYIDPPYNTGSDSFQYNDSFNHSSWLVFMKNRLELAKRFLTKDGVIFVQCDDNEQAYLKVLMDNIFGNENFINNIVWKRKGGSVNPQNKLNSNVDYILIYSRSQEFKINPIYTINDLETQKYIKERFKNVDENGRLYRLSPIISPTYSASLIYEYKGYNPPKNGWSLSKNKMIEFDNEGRLYFPEDKTQRIQRKQFLDEYKGRPVGDLWTDINVINSMSNERLSFVGQKPESLIKRVLDISTNEFDLVLDFHIGTGTTAAVAHKMKRRYIGVEQMDYIEDITIERLKKVVDGEQGGISKAVAWQGGGSFVYCELLENASELIDKIQSASEDTIFDVKDVIYSDDRIVPYITRDELKKADEEFADLELDEKKKVLISLVDKNKLYVNYSDMYDESYAVSEQDKAFTESFYVEG